MNPALRAPFLAPACVLALLVVPTAHAAAPPEIIVRELVPYLVDAGHDPADPAGWPEGFATLLDVSPDGTPDWRIDFTALGLPGGCSTGGCRNQVWVSDGNTWRLALDQQVVEIERRHGATGTIDVELHGSHCGLPGNAPCSRAFLWDPARRRLVETASAGGDTLLAGPLFQPLATDIDEWPEMLIEARNAAEDRCIAAGGRDFAWDAPASSVPDIDGDGERDWVLDERWINCDTGGGATSTPDSDAMLRVYSSNRGAWREQFAVPATDWAVDISSRPASLVIITP